MSEPIVVVYSSRRWRESLEAVRDHLGPVVCVTSDAGELLGLKWKRPTKQRSLFDDL